MGKSCVCIQSWLRVGSRAFQLCELSPLSESHTNVNVGLRLALKTPLSLLYTGSSMLASAQARNQHEMCLFHYLPLHEITTVFFRTIYGQTAAKHMIHTEFC